MSNAHGVTDLETLLASMEPILDEAEYVYCTLPETSSAWSLIGQLRPEVVVRETEGLTLVLRQITADEYNQRSTSMTCNSANGSQREMTPSLAYTGTCAKISLQVHSSLEAIGLTAAFGNRLSQVGVSANVVAGYFHDHIFVAPALSSGKAMEALHSLSTEAKARAAAR